MGSGLAILTHATLFPWPGRCASNIRCGAKKATPLTSPVISCLLTAPQQKGILRPLQGGTDETGVSRTTTPPPNSLAHQPIPTPSRAEHGLGGVFVF